MRFYNQSHRFYCGVDLHARSMYLCILDQAGTILLHQNFAADPKAFLQAVAPSCDGLVVAAECMFAWYWLAARPLPPTSPVPSTTIAEIVARLKRLEQQKSKPATVQVQVVQSPYLDTEESAAYLRINVNSLYGLVERGRLVPLRGPRRRYRFTKAMLDAYLAGERKT